MNNSESHSKEHQSDNNEKRDLRVFRYRAYRCRQGLKTYFINLWWDLRHKLQKSEFAIEVLGIAVLAVYTVYTIKMYTANRDSADAAKVAANAAKSAAETSAKQLEMAERPWMSANFVITSPLKFGGEGGRVTVSLLLKNSGHSPAMQGTYELKFIVPFLEHPDSFKEREEVCKRVEGGSALPHNRRFNATWFPGDQTPIDISLPITRSDIQNSLVDIPRSLFPDTPLNFPKPTIWPVLIGCIAYRPTFANTTYSTGYVLDLLHVDPASGSILFLEPTGDIPAGALRFRLHFATGIYAK